MVLTGVGTHPLYVALQHRSFLHSLPRSLSILALQVLYTNRDMNTSIAMNAKEHVEAVKAIAPAILDTSKIDHPDSIRNDVDIKSLHRVVMSKIRDSDFVLLLNALSTACKLISR